MSSYSLLIVDDEPDNFDVIEALLPSESYQLHYASCGEDAIAALDKFDPDVILLDVMMPGINGIEVCKRIKLMSQWQGVPIIMVTALSSKEDLARCLAAGADDFVNKPVNGLELRARVNSMLRIKKQHDRIQSFSKLQRNNIHALSNNLNEIRLDLAVGFPQEFDIPLTNLADNIEHLKQNVAKLSLAETLEILESSDRATLRLHQLTHKFWFYLQLLLETPDANKSSYGISIPKFIIDRNLTARFAESIQPHNLVCEIEDTTLAVNVNHANWIFNELLSYLFAHSDDEAHLQINGQVVNDAFHFSLSSCQGKNPKTLNPEISHLIQFNSAIGENKELEIGLKIVKKIVEIYDGVFLISGDEGNELTIYTTLPLVVDSDVEIEPQVEQSESSSSSRNFG